MIERYAACAIISKIIIIIIIPGRFRAYSFAKLIQLICNHVTHTPRLILSRMKLNHINKF